ncbi:hypothetical protein [Clostridium butyricum]|uniref:Uncharacterized protein n=1 Tax=Clostridium butyricum TaxID=1492 RepID=A0A2S7FFA6_CLOBU|nr:hypothetical protein [Clostridium butyricum]PPV17767.1 hypothetical protein AWN73_07120 [Clostridium butyricum]
MRKEIARLFEREMYDDMYNAIIYFLSSVEIREGKFEGNEILIHKLDRETVILYQEYQLDNDKYEHSRNAFIYDIKLLLEELREYKVNDL